MTNTVSQYIRKQAFKAEPLLTKLAGPRDDFEDYAESVYEPAGRFISRTRDLVTYPIVTPIVTARDSANGISDYISGVLSSTERLGGNIGNTIGSTIGMIAEPQEASVTDTGPFTTITERLKETEIEEAFRREAARLRRRQRILERKNKREEQLRKAVSSSRFF